MEVDKENTCYSLQSEVDALHRVNCLNNYFYKKLVFQGVLFIIGTTSIVAFANIYTLIVCGIYLAIFVLYQKNLIKVMYSLKQLETTSTLSAI